MPKRLAPRAPLTLIRQDRGARSAPSSERPASPSPTPAILYWAPIVGEMLEASVWLTIQGTPQMVWRLVAPNAFWTPAHMDLIAALVRTEYGAVERTSADRPAPPTVWRVD